MKGPCAATRMRRDSRMDEFLTTRELADLLRIKERKVYELAASGEVPVSRATGKLLFPRRAVQAWIARHSSGTAPEPAPPRPLVCAGSHDPLLEWALRESRSGLATYFDGSLDGIERFAARGAVAAGIHVYQPPTAEWNTHLVRERFGADAVVLVEFAWRERGLVIAPEMQGRIAGIADLAGRRLVPRQAEAGSQTLLEHLLAEAGLGPDRVELTAPARTETDAVLAVVQGKADAAFGLLGVAEQFGLGFVPVMRERFDLLFERRDWFEPALQAVAAFCRTQAFRERAAEQGYDVSGFGRVQFNGP